MNKARSLSTHFHLFTGAIDDYRKGKNKFRSLVRYLSKVIEDIREFDKEIAQTLHDYWLDLSIISEIFVLRMDPDLTEEDDKRIENSFSDMIDYLEHYVRLDLIDLEVDNFVARELTEEDIIN